MNPVQQGLDFLTEFGNLSRESTNRWLEQQRAVTNAVVAVHRARFAALQNAKQLEDWAAAERACVTALNEQALDGLKANIELALDHFSRLARLYGHRTGATAGAAR